MYETFAGDVIPSIEMKLKQEAQRQQAKSYGDTCQTSAAGMAGEPRPYSLCEEAASRAQNHYQEASKAQSAALFFTQHPEFEDFIRLVRQGAIQF